MKIEQVQEKPHPVYSISELANWKELIEYLWNLSSTGPIPVSVEVHKGIYIFRTTSELRQFVFGMQLMWNLIHDKHHPQGGDARPPGP